MTVLKSLTTAAKLTFPTKEMRHVSYCIVTGSMGTGKTTLVSHAIEQLCANQDLLECVSCFARVDTFAESHNLTTVDFDKVRSSHDEDFLLPTNILSTLLMSGFIDAFEEVVRWKEASPIIRKAFPHMTRIILHLDEFQKYPNVTNHLMWACKSTLTTQGYIPVIPTLSGVSTVRLIIDGFDPSDWRPERGNLGPLPMDALEAVFMEALNVEKAQYAKCELLQALFKDCGGYAHQVVCLLDQILRRKEIAEKIRQGQFGEDTAQHVLQACITFLTQVFGFGRWHALFTRQLDFSPGEGDVFHRDSFQESTKKVLTKVVFSALAKTKHAEDDILWTISNVKPNRNIKWSKIKELGTVDLEFDQSRSFTVEASLMALLVMNKVIDSEAIPLSANLEDPHHDNWQTLECVAQLCLRAQMLARDAGVLVCSAHRTHDLN